MVNFTGAVKRNKTYPGANGSKISIVYNDELYMLKFPSKPTRKTDLNYTNSCISEYIGCSIYKSVGIPTQDVILGTYSIKSNRETIVAACKDFAINGLVIQDFASLKNQIIDFEGSGYGTELTDILSVIDLQTAVDVKILSDCFWDMFVVDALIGNCNRHNGDWGFLYDSATDKMTLAPVFDCGSCLFPQLDEEAIHETLLDGDKINDLVFNRPTSAIIRNGKRINYFEFMSSCENKDCNEALKRIAPRIDMNKINKLIDETMPIADEHKLFLKTILSARKELIIDFSYNKLRKTERLATDF